MRMWRELFKTSSSIKPGEYLLIIKDTFTGLLGKNVSKIERMRGKVMQVTSIDKDHDTIHLALPGSLSHTIPYKNWKEYAVPFDDVK